MTSGFGVQPHQKCENPRFEDQNQAQVHSAKLEIFESKIGLVAGALPDAYVLRLLYGL